MYTYLNYNLNNDRIILNIIYKFDFLKQVLFQWGNYLKSRKRYSYCLSNNFPYIKCIHIHHNSHSFLICSNKECIYYIQGCIFMSIESKFNYHTQCKMIFFQNIVCISTIQKRFLLGRNHCMYHLTIKIYQNCIQSRYFIHIFYNYRSCMMCIIKNLNLRNFHKSQSDKN